MRIIACLMTAIALVACVDTALDTPASHPANPSLAPAPPTQAPAALTSGFDPFVAFAAESAPHQSSAAPGEVGHAGHDHAEHARPAVSEQGAAPAGDAIVYTCPMHPEIVRDAPGNCPICGMKLVPKKPSAQPAP